MTKSDVNNDEFLSIGSFASMSLDPADYHCEPEEADRFMSQTASDLFKKVLTQIKQGKICHVAQKTIGLSDYLVVDLHDFRCKHFHLPDDKDLHYPIQASIGVETLDSNIFKRAEKYREGVYVWLADGGKIEDDIFIPDENFMQEEMLRLEAEEKALETLKQRLNTLGLKWMNKEQSQNELERLLSGIEPRKQTLDDLETAQWHYMDVVEITSSGLFDEEQLGKERRDQPHLLKKEGDLTVFEDDQCILFMSQKHGISLPLCAAYVLSDAWR